MARSTKGQVQMVETIVIIFIFIILFVFGLLWYSNFKQADVVKEIDTEIRLSLLEKTKEVINMPEFQCSIGGTQDSTCIDFYRAKAFMELTDTSAGGYDSEFEDRYRERFFGYALNFHTFYPDPMAFGRPDLQSGVLFDYKPPQANNKLAALIPIVLYDPVSEHKYFGMLELIQYTEERQ